jgi:polysaccharide biosynthesis protein domain protein
MSYQASNKRLVKNTAFLYARTLILLVLGVFTSRITLQALGVDNYGIVNVVSGFVAMFTLVSSSLTGACQRFLTFELGKADGDIRKIFCASFYIHVFLSLLIVIIAETFGLYFINHHLNLPPGRGTAVQWVFQCSIASLVISLINIPYNAMIIAYEKMKIFAYISLLEGALKLAVVLILLLAKTDVLILYAVLGLASSIIIRAVFQIYCRHTFKDAIKVRNRPDKEVVKSIFGFAGWSFIGNAATLFSNQGVNIVLNIFSGVAVNAARGLASMIESVVVSFVDNFTTALNPQITKAYASNEKEQMYSLVHLGMRISFFFMIIISIPVIIAAPQLLSIWFTEVPEYTVIFVRLTLCVAIIHALGKPFLTVLLATGDIKTYQLVVGTITFLNLPLSYIALKLGYGPVSVYVIALGVVITTFSIRLIYVRKKASMKVGPAIRIILFKFSYIILFSFVASWGISNLINVDNIWLLGTYFLLAALTICLIVFVFGLNTAEKRSITDKVKPYLRKIK